MIEGTYSGALVEGVREGEGSLQWANGDVYEGQFKNGLRHGKGRYDSLPIRMLCLIYNPNRLFHRFVEKNGRVYNGNWSLSMKQGEGVETFKNGDEYTGQCLILL